MRWLFIMIGTVVCSPLWAQTTQNEQQEINYRLIVEHESAIETGDGNYQKSEWIIDPEISWKVNSNIRFFTQLRFYSELTDNLQPGDFDFSTFSNFSKPLDLGDRSYLELREFYFDLNIGKSYWRIGKQQVVWGEMDGFKILDQLNPMYFREFILDDFDDSRIPMWSVKGDWKWKSLNFQAYWSPDITSHAIPASNAVFRPYNPVNLTTDTNVGMSTLNRSNHLIKDSDFGFEISTSLNTWDLSLNYIYQYDKMPIPERIYHSNTSILEINPVLKRQHILGASFGTIFGTFGVRGELAAMPNKSLMNIDFTDEDGITSTNQLLSGMALDYYGLSDAIITFQWFGNWVEDKKYASQMNRDQLINTATIMHSQYFINQKLLVEVFGGYRFSEKGFLVDMKSSYMIRDNLKIWVGGDVFIASNPGILQPYDKNDRILLGFEWGIQN